jgi:hypothetical protein
LKLIGNTRIPIPIEKFRWDRVDPGLGVTLRVTQRGVAAAKSEARNPKFETNPNDKNTNDLNKFKNKTGNLLNKISRD